MSWAINLAEAGAALGMCADSDAVVPVVYPVGAASAGPGDERVVAAGVAADAAASGVAFALLAALASGIACMDEEVGVVEGGWAINGAVPAYVAVLTLVVPVMVVGGHAGLGVADIELAIDPLAEMGAIHVDLVAVAVDPAGKIAPAAASALPACWDRPPPPEQYVS